MSKKNKMKTPKKLRVIFIIVTFFCLFLTLLSVLFYTKKQKQVKNSYIKKIVNKEAPMELNKKSSPNYIDELKKYNDKKAEEAEKNGSSFIPAIINQGDAIKAGEDDFFNEDEHKEKPLLSEPLLQTNMIPSPSQGFSDEAELSRLQKNNSERNKILQAQIQKELLKIIEINSYQPHSSEVYKPTSFTKKQNPGTSSPALPSKPNRKEPLKIGQVLYASLDQEMNSDLPVPANTATILTGPYKKSKVVGRFQRIGGFLRITFSKLIKEDSTELKINAYAVKPDAERSPALRSSINNHTIKRWGGLAAASFLEGFGNSVSNSGVVEKENDDGSIRKTYPEYSVTDQLWIASGKMGERAASIAEKNFYTPPTVILKRDQPIGILVIDIKE